MAKKDNSKYNVNMGNKGCILQKKKKNKWASRINFLKKTT